MISSGAACWQRKGLLSGQLNDPLNDSIVTSDGESYAEDSDASSDRVEIDLCGYCGDKFDNEDSLNLHIASAHCE